MQQSPGAEAKADEVSGANEHDGLPSEEGCGVDAGATVVNSEGNSGKVLEDITLCTEEKEESVDGQSSGESAHAAGVETEESSLPREEECADAAANDTLMTEMISMTEPKELEAGSWSGSAENECGTSVQGERASPSEVENEDMPSATVTAYSEEDVISTLEVGADALESEVTECGNTPQEQGDAMEGIITTECCQAEEDMETNEQFPQADETMAASEAGECAQLDDPFATIRDATDSPVSHFPRGCSRTGSANRLPSLWVNSEARPDADWASAMFSGDARTSQHCSSFDTHTGSSAFAEALLALPKALDGRRKTQSPSPDTQLCSLAVKFGGDYNVCHVLEMCVTLWSRCMVVCMLLKG